MDKKKRHHSLEKIQATFVSVQALRITKTATSDAAALDLELEDIVSIIKAMKQAQFYKSMTSLASSEIWQDVYHVPHGGLVLYVKFTTDSEGYVLVSCKEK